ncbi:MAG: hypothetical protein WCJ30_15390, partial [Deltaproteobacteria bacterium]
MRLAWILGAFASAVQLVACSTPRPVFTDGGGDVSRVCAPGVRTCNTLMDCQDQSVCNGTEQCNNGCCTRGNVLSCTSPYACVTGSCNEEAGGCVSRLNHTSCNTAVGERCTATLGCALPGMIDCSETGDQACVLLGGDPCVGIFTCDPANHHCRSGSPTNCDDMSPCTVDSCTVANGMAACQHTPNVDLTSDPANCGICRRQCQPGPHQLANCTASNCIVGCITGWLDANHDPLDGCECMGGSALDTPDMLFVDSNCDGIDGDAAGGVFVADFGDDAAAGTMAAPLRTIQAGISMAALRPLKQVYVSTGTYTGPVRLMTGVSIYGGYDALAAWTRARTNVSTIRSASANAAVTGNNITVALEIQLFAITSQPTVAPGASSYAMRITASTGHITVRGCSIDAGNGGVGIDGYDGLDGGRGSDATAGGGGSAG